MSGVVAEMVGDGESADQVWFGGGCGGAAGAAECRSHLHHGMLGFGVEVIDRQKNGEGGKNQQNGHDGPPVCLFFASCVDAFRL